MDGGHGGAHALRFEVPPIAAPRYLLPERRRVLPEQLFEPSGDYDAVIVAVTDDGRRRYFTTRDGAHLVEVDEVSFQRRRESGTRSMLELDERELGELEVELQFVRPVRGRDPIAEAEGAEAAWVRPSSESNRAESESEPRSEPRVEVESEGGSRSALCLPPDSYTGRPSLRSRPRVRCSRSKRRKTRWTTR